MAVLPYDGPLRNELEKNGVPVVIHHNLPIVTRPGFHRARGLIDLMLAWPISVLRLSSAARKFRPDIIHTNTAVILSSGLAARLAGVPHVWHVRETFVEFPGLWRWYQWFMDYLSDVIVCVSAPVAEQFDRNIRERKIVVAHNGFPKEEFAPVEPARVAKFLESFGLNGYLTVGVVGRIKFGRKGQDVFVRSAALLKDKFPNARFVLVGSPFPGNEAHFHNLMSLVKDLGVEDRVVYTGDVQDIKAALAALDISALPSGLPEPFAGVVIESMALGKPVVGSKHGGTVEQIEDGVTGFLVEPNDPEALAAALERLLCDADLRRRMGENGRERFMRLFEFEAAYQKMLSIYARARRG